MLFMIFYFVTLLSIRLLEKVAGKVSISFGARRQTIHFCSMAFGVVSKWQRTRSSAVRRNVLQRARVYLGAANCNAVADGRPREACLQVEGEHSI